MYVDTDQVHGIESFSYTIGFEKSYNHPEIITFGLPAESAHGILSATAAAIKEGESLPLHVPVENILGGDLKVLFKPLDLFALRSCCGLTRKVSTPPKMNTVSRCNAMR